MNIRKLISDRMAAEGMTRVELSRKAGVSHRLVYQYLDPDNPGEIRSDKFLAILEALGISIVAGKGAARGK